MISNVIFQLGPFCRSSNQISLIYSIVFQKRRSNRQVKRKKYAEELEARLSDDEVKVIVKAKKTNPASKESGHQLFVVSIFAQIATAVLQKLV